MIVPVQRGLKQYIETIIELNYHLSSVFTSVIFKTIWNLEVNIIYQGSLEKRIGEIHLSGSLALVDYKAQHESECSPRDNGVIFSK